MADYIERPEFEQYAHRMDDENTRQNHRIEIVEKSVEKITDLTIAINEMSATMKQMVEEQKSMSQRLKVIEDEPRETIKTVRAAVLSAIGGAVAAAVVAAIISFI